MNMKVNIAGVEFNNPVMEASGTFGSGAEFGEFVDLNKLGAVVTKGVANVPWPGNPTPRIAETSCGMLNAIGLQNPGIDLFVQRDIPFLKQYDTKIIVNVCGKSTEDYLEVVERLGDEPVDGFHAGIGTLVGDDDLRVSCGRRDRLDDVFPGAEGVGQNLAGLSALGSHDDFKGNLVLEVIEGSEIHAQLLVKSLADLENIVPESVLRLHIINQLEFGLSALFRHDDIFDDGNFGFGFGNRIRLRGLNISLAAGYGKEHP